MSKPAGSQKKTTGLVAGSILLLLGIRGCTYVVEQHAQATQVARAAPCLEPLNPQRRRLELRPIGQMQPPRYLPDALATGQELVVLEPAAHGREPLKFESKLLAIKIKSGQLLWEEDRFSFAALAAGGTAHHTLSCRYSFERARRAQQPWLIRLTSPADNFQLARHPTGPPVGEASLTRLQADSILRTWRTRSAPDLRRKAGR